MSLPPCAPEQNTEKASICLDCNLEANGPVEPGCTKHPSARFGARHANAHRDKHSGLHTLSIRSFNSIVLFLFVIEFHGVIINYPLDLYY